MPAASPSTEGDAQRNRPAYGALTEVTTDKAHALTMALRAVIAAAWHDTTQHANNRVESDHSQLKARLRPMRGLKRDHNASVVITGHAFIQNLRRGHYELGTYARRHLIVAAASDELTPVL